MGIININPALPPLPRGLSFAGQFILLTGATSGIGFESARELLRHGVSKLYLPVRNLEKGEATRKTLLQDPVVIKENPDAAIELFELDLETYSSVLSFSKAFDAKVNRIDGAILNGGTATWKFTPLPAPPFNEITLQTNFLSNALLSLLLLPALERGSLSGSHKSHLLFVASIGAQKTSWEKEPFKYTPSGVVTSLNNSKNYAPFERYGTSVHTQSHEMERFSQIVGPRDLHPLMML
jgi:NAD(P)-dependent dehydrogenase (short-subunit alcohol dehydrogenase family)